jgi:cytidyltransferase-like protein
MKYKLAVCGGTFDLLHKGHKKFIAAILDQSEKLIIGLTSDNYVNNFKVSVFESYDTRKAKLEEYLASIRAIDRIEIVLIEDVYGPLLNKDLEADALFVTANTLNGAEEINKKRKSLNLPEIKIESIGMEKSEDGELLSSTRIREGEIDRDGELFVKPQWKNKKLVLPKKLRSELAKPIGNILLDVPLKLSGDKTITIGDVTTQLFNGANIGQKLSIVDFVVKRERKFDQLSQLGFLDRIEVQIVDNPAGEISWDLFESIKKSLETEQSVILVNGEEDLAVLPAVLIAPLGYKIYYGQPNEGLVEVTVDEQTKKRGRELAAKFDHS